MNGLQIASLFATVDLEDKVTPGLNNVRKSLGDFASNVGKQMQDIGRTMTVGLTLPIMGFLGASVKAAADSEAGVAQLNAVLKSTKGIAGVTSKAAQDLASSLQKVTRFSDDAVLGAENMLLTFTNISKDVFPDTVKIALDMSQALGQDLKSSSIQLGKALQDPINGVTALSRVGVNFTKAQKDQIKAMVEAGNVMGAQKLILKELRTEFGGSAEAAGNTFAGKLDILKNKFDDLMEKIGGALIPILEKGMAIVSGFVDKLASISPETLQLALGIGLVLAAAGPLLGILGTIGVVIGAILSPIGLVVAGIAALGGALYLAVTGQLPAIIDKVGEFVGNLVGKIGDFIATNAPKVIAALQPLLWKFTDGVQDIFEKVSLWIEWNAWPAIQEAFNTLMNSIADFFKNGGATALLGAWLEIVVKIYRWIIDEGIPRVVDAFTWVLQGVHDFLVGDGSTQTKTGFQNALESAMNWIRTDGVPMALDAFGEIIKAIIEKAPDITFAISKAVVQGFANSPTSILNGPTPDGPMTQDQAINQVASNPVGTVFGSLVDLIFGGGRAAGGPVSSGSTYLVGEKGPELFSPGSSGTITPNAGGYNGPSVLHVILQAEQFEQHLYLGVAEAMGAA